jgi:hypothetical protein
LIPAWVNGGEGRKGEKRGRKGERKEERREERERLTKSDHLSSSRGPSVDINTHWLSPGGPAHKTCLIESLIISITLLFTAPHCPSRLFTALHALFTVTRTCRDKTMMRDCGPPPSPQRIHE